MEGFRYKYLMAKVDYKAIQFKTKDGHKFTVSDFETSNLRELEKTCLKIFELKTTEKFLPLDEEGKKREIQSSRYFDIAQAKQIRDMLIIGIIFTIIIIGSTIYKNNGPLSTGKILFYIISTFMLLRMTKKLIKTIGTVKNSA
jgi:hypothetical protein